MNLDSLIKVRDALNLKARVDPELYGLADQVAAVIRAAPKSGSSVDGFLCDKPATTWLYLIGKQRGSEFDVTIDQPVFFSRLDAETQAAGVFNILAVPMDRAYVCPPLSPVNP